MLRDGKIWVAQSDKAIELLPKMANRHGLIAGATGTGKTVTMKVLAEGFSDLGVPVFFSDVKGDLTGMCKPGQDSEAMQKRLNNVGADPETFQYKSYPTRFWDLYGECGHRVRVTISALGPTLLASLLGLTDVQEGVLNIAFKAADDQGLLLLDMKDLRAMLQYVGDNRDEYTTLYGNVSTASIGAIQRALLKFEQEDGEHIFGEPMLEITDWIRTDTDGRGFINILSSSRLIQSPTVYATFLLWMLTELYEKLPEVGDLEKPRMVFFFDEAHFLFTNTPKALEAKIEQVVKLIRSKGVGVYFVTQNPMDIPDAVLAQLSNRIQHGLRAYTPSEQKAVRAAAQAFRVNEAFDTEEALMALGTGEALISVLDEKGIPSIVEKGTILPPQSLLGQAPAEEVQQLILSSEFDLKYKTDVDRESAYEIIERAKQQLADQQAEEQAQAEAEKAAAAEAAEAEKAEAKAAKEKKKPSATEKALEKAAKNAASSVAGSLGTNMVNAVTGGKTKDAGSIAKQAASNALRSVMRSGASGLIRGLFGNLK